MFPFPAPAIIRSATAILKPQDVFATSVYAGNTTARKITTGVDLQNRGGLIWFKSRDTANNPGHGLIDTVRGIPKYLDASNSSASTSLEFSMSNTVTSFDVDGFSLGTAGYTNSGSLAAWTFARARGFFDVLTWTGDGTNNRQIPHILGVVPGVMGFKRLDAAEDWFTYHRGVTAPNANWWTNYLRLNAPGAAAADTSGPNQPTAAYISVNGDFLNAAGKRYVAYLFAHDPSADGIVQCGSFTTDANGIGTATTGWAPQFMIVKRIDAAGHWWMFDTARGWGAGNDASIKANTSDAEVVQDLGGPTANGFTISGFGTGLSCIYLAIRAPY